MAGLPNNTSYTAPSTDITVPKVSKSFSQEIEALRGGFNKGVKDAFPSLAGGNEGPTPAELANSSNIVPTNYSFTPSDPNPRLPTGRTFTDPTTELKRSQSLAESGYQAEYAWGEKPGDSAVVRTTPTMGQYITDTNKPEKIWRSERPDVETWNSIRKRALDGRDTDMYEVDHVIPLWLGGTNNQENLQVIDRQTHSRKVRAEAVALTLFANKKIDKKEALRMAMTWQSRDLTDFPEVTRNPVFDNGQTSGQMTLSAAEQVYAKWKQQEGTIQKVSMFKDFFKKETALSRGDYIDQKTEWMPDFIQGITKGFLGAGSANAIQYRKEANNGGADETFGRVLGAIGGSLLPIGAMGRVFGAITGLNKVRQGVTTGLRAKGILKGTTAVGNTAVGLTEGVASGIVKGKNLLPFSKGTFDPRVQSLIRAHSDNFVKWTPPVVLYGQASVSFEDEPERGARLFEDIVYGGLTGFMAPNIKGAAKAAFFAGTASMMFDAYSSNRDVSWENALVNALMIGGLHQISAPGIRAQAQVELKKESTRMANNIIGLYVPSVKTVKPGAELPVYTAEEVKKITDEARGALLKQVGGSSDGKTAARLNDEEFGRQYQALGAALDVFNMSVVKEAQVPGYLATRMRQWSELANNPAKREEAFGGTRPKNAEKVVQNIPNDLIENSIPFNKTTLFPTGRMRTTGLAENYNSDMGDIGKFIARSAEGRVSPTLVAIARPERTAFNKILSADVNTKWNDSNPENTLQVFARTIDEKGNPEVLNIGYIPQEKRIDGGEYSFNSQPEIQSGKYPAYDKILNKDTLNEKMIEEGIDYLLLSFRKADYVKNAQGQANRNQPYLEFEIGEQNWRRSIDIQRNGGAGVAPKVAVDGPEAVLERVNTAKNKEAVQTAKNDYLSNYDEPAFKALDDTSPVIQTVDAESIAMAKNLLEKGNEALSQPSAKEMSDNIYKNFGFKLSDDAATVLFEKRQGVTVSSFLKLVNKNSNETMQFVYKEQIAPALQQLTDGSNWDKAKIFREMRVLGKQEPIPTVTEIAQNPVARETVVSAPIKDVTAPVETIPTNPRTQSIAQTVATVAPQKTPEILPQLSPETVATNARVAARPKLIQDIASSVEVVIPESTPIRTDRQTRIDQIVSDTVQEGKDVLQKIRFTQRSGEEGYQKSLSGVVRNIEANVNPSAPVGGGLPLNRVEKALIKQDVMDELSMEAQRIYGSKIDISNSIDFKTGMKKGENLYDEVSQIQNAMNALALGVRKSNDPMVALREQMGDKVFEKAYRLLNPSVGDMVKNVGLTKKTSSRKSIGFKGGLLGDVYFSDLQENSGKEIIADIIDRSKANARPGTYMSVFADVLDTSFTKMLGKGWRGDGEINRLFSGLRNPKEANIWQNLLIRSEGDATQPLEYIRSRGKGQIAKSKRVANERREQNWVEKNQRLDEQSQQKGDESGNVPSNNDAPEGTRVLENSQANDILAPSPLDTIMAGFTSANDAGYTPTAEQALSDAIQFMFAVNKAKNIKFNTRAATEVVDEVLARLKSSGERVSNVKNPIKKAGSYFSEARDKKREADKLLVGELQKRYNSLLGSSNPGKTPYSEFRGVKGEMPIEDKITALGAAMVKRGRDATYGKWKSKQTREELLFADSFKKFQNLMTEADELNRSKEIMKVDAKAKKDGKGGPGPMDGKGGPIGDAWEKVKDFMSNTVTYTKPKDIKAFELPKTPKIPTTPQKKYNVKGYDMEETDFNDLVSIGFGEASNRSPDKQKLEMRVLLETAANRAKKGNYGGSTLIDVLRSPNQYQAYSPGKEGSQYELSKSKEIDGLSKEKLNNIRRMVTEVGSEPNQFEGALYYIHASDGTIWTGATQKEAFKYARDYENKKGLTSSGF